MERKFKTTAKCAGCVKAIGEKLSKELAADQWSIDLTSPDRVLTVAADTPSDARIEELVREAGFKIEKLYRYEQVFDYSVCRRTVIAYGL